MGYVELNGHPSWVTSTGAGELVLLLHGGFGDGEEFGGNLAALADRFRVVMADRRGHGRTADHDGPLSQHAMADDTVALLEQLDAGPARLVGFSDGAVVALLTALRRPDLVERLVLLSGVFEAGGWLVTPTHEDAEDVPEVLVERYAEVSPDGRDHFVVIAHKLADMAEEDLAITSEHLAGLDRRVLVVAADDDIVHPEHTLALYRALPRAELAVVPGTSHGLLHDKPELVTRLVREFLEQDARPTLIPIRRAAG
ncbi:alpha/beta fold hydrolase [Desertihabitans aurantiacus]|uniref:alpha/beta fold hydrolase n=1 Tax=Desertihabitans aurantiacus TaxID=2282477 RepID=UPI000DF7D67A|nr:alpha/beta hydrolase [Desertihabitans aurantiacus]